MTLEELDIALEELEVRLERLRALYEQYFLGFEKIEPSVARKDVDRRIYVLRREKIRNTGKRFKLQTIIQRYNTFQQYWQRICREIENGTYKRHLLRAERLAPEQQLTIAARRRFGRLAAAEEATKELSGSNPPAAFQRDGDDAATRVRSHSTPPPDSDERTTVRPMPMQAVDPAGRRAPPAKPERLERLKPASSRPPTPPDKYDSLELDMGFLGSWSPPAAKAAATTAAAPPAATESRLSPPRPAPPRAAPAAGQPATKSSPKGAPPPRPAAPPREVAPPPKPAAPAREVAPPKAPPPKPGRAETPMAHELSDERVKDLHQRLAALKKENREGGQVSYESLAKTVRETEARLRAQHKDRKIDFEVVLRDGKAIVKPTVR